MAAQILHTALPAHGKLSSVAGWRLCRDPRPTPAAWEGEHRVQLLKGNMCLPLQPEKIWCQEEMTLHEFYCCCCKITMDKMSCLSLSNSLQGGSLLLPALLYLQQVKPGVGELKPGEHFWMKSGAVKHGTDFCRAKLSAQTVPCIVNGTKWANTPRTNTCVL